MTDQGFPIIEYPAGQTPTEWGHLHGESYRNGIVELYDIRIDLMRQRNPSLTEAHIHRLANEQWTRTAAASEALASELDGICQGSGLSREQLVVLNNYTDFRDIQLPDEGCSTVYVERNAGSIAGQTWDMHGSAKNYVCCLRIPTVKGETDQPASVVFSLVGCVGMMGYTSAGTVVGVNNINTDGAVPGILWPVVVRQMLQYDTYTDMTNYLRTADVTSGHNYLVADASRADMWEVLPQLSERVSWLEPGESGLLFHTNHCLGEHTQLRETPTSQNSTTHIRFDLLAKKADDVSTLEDVYQLLNDHENYPKSICSNFQSDTQDPSVTCGGALGDLTKNSVVMWRGDEQYDDNFVKHTFQL